MQLVLAMDGSMIKRNETNSIRISTLLIIPTNSSLTIGFKVFKEDIEIKETTRTEQKWRSPHLVCDYFVSILAKWFRNSIHKHTAQA